MSWILKMCVFLLVFVPHSHYSSASRILFFHPIGSKSHANVFEPLIRGLSQRGHEIVNLTPSKLQNVPENIKQIEIMTSDEIYGDLINPFEMRRMGKLTTLMNGSFNWLNIACEKLIQRKEFQDLAKNEKFDLVIVHVLMNYCTAGALPMIGAPTILYSTMSPPAFLSIFIGNRMPPSFVVDPALSFTPNMSFIQRLVNTVVNFLIQFIGSLTFFRMSEDVYRKHLNESLPGLPEILSNTSMIFANSHFTLTYPKPLLPDSIEVGGMHARPAKPLPKDINDFLEGSGEDGFIFFSLGSIVKAKEMPEELRKTFVRVFEKLKQRVIWKWETESMPEVKNGSNILLRKWLPQQDILGHPKIKLFMTHGGLLSTQEAVYHGVPCLGLPVLGDQDQNVKQAEVSGYARSVEVLDLKEETLEDAIKDMLNDPRYLNKAKELSKLVRDLPQSPLEKAIFWTEYVIRHNGAPHLRSAARDLNFFQYYVIDVALVVGAVLVIVFLVIFKTLKWVMKKLFGSKRTTEQRRETLKKLN